METATFKPTVSKRLVLWLTLSLFTTAGVLWLVRSDLADPIAVGIALGYVILASFLISWLMYSLAFFRIQVDRSQISGPWGWGQGWKRITIPIAEIDLRRTNATFACWGIYLLQAGASGAISIWGFDAAQYRQILELLRSRGARTG